MWLSDIRMRKFLKFTGIRLSLIRLVLDFFALVVIMLLAELSDRIKSGERGLAFNVITLFIAIASILIGVQDKLAHFLQQL
mgnify:CR=1 FL=1